jgi:hypothetical protein
MHIYAAIHKKYKYYTHIKATYCSNRDFDRQFHSNLGLYVNQIDIIYAHHRPPLIIVMLFVLGSVYLKGFRLLYPQSGVFK